MVKKTEATTGLVFLLSIVSLVLAASLLLALFIIYKNNQNKVTPLVQNQLNKKPIIPAIKINNNFTVLRLDPSYQMLAVNQSIKLNLKIDTGNNTVAGIDFVLSFNPKLISITAVTPAGFFDNPDILINKADNSLGTLRFGIGSTKPKMGNGNLVTLTITGKSSGETQINFTEKTKVAGITEGPINVLKTAEGAKITVN